ncbi:fimbrial protein [Providencia manganoxydans]|uniref:fimbrial protein n=1 Tax=Providencia manganoxydans TaxID=2923283 RepID=UPI00280F9357|nr:fimbrial protein [Providencia stuartii]ELR5081129.1 fimbrial protein [Providencia stuartii]
MLNKQKCNRWLYSLIGCAILINSNMTQAVQLEFTGNLLENPPCDVAGPNGLNQPIKIGFGDVGISRINGENYRQDFTITMTCGSDLGNAVALYLTYGTNAYKAPFDNKALGTTTSGLGIRLYHEGVVIGPGTGTKMVMSSNGTSRLDLYAVPVRDPNPATILIEGDFTASATVQMLYP